MDPEKRVRELERQVERYRRIVETMEEGYYEVDLQGRFTFVNDSFTRIVGYGREELLGSSYGQFTMPEDVERIYRMYNEVYRTGRPVKAYDFILRTRDGRVHHLETSARLMLDNKRQPVGFSGIVRDVSRRREVERQVKEERERFRTLVEQIPVGICLIRPDGVYEYVNPGFTRIFGYTLTEVPDGRTWFRKAFPDPQKRHEVVATWKQDLASASAGAPRIRTLEVTCKDGSLKTVQMISVELTTGEQMTISMDVTQLKDLEAQLLQAQKMEGIGRLAGGVAHDFNNILTAILGHVDLCLLRHGTDPELAHRLDQIKKGAERAADLTRQLLAFSRRQILQPEVLDLNMVLEDMDRMIRPIIGEDISVETYYEKDLWSVLADRGQMQQVIMNLVVNARDAMPEGGKLTLETANIYLDREYAERHDVRLEPGPYVMLAVSDTGLGMDEDTRKRVFEPFFTTKETGKGTGLGLSTAYGIVKQSGGYIWVYSEPGEGTTFKIYLPRTEEAPQAAKAQRLESERLTGSETVLVVEDEKAVLNMVKEILTRSGYRVLEAREPQEALEHLRSYPDVIDLMITDVVMPGMNGKTLSQEAASLRPSVKTLFMSGYTNNAVAHRGILDPDVHFLQKPFRANELLQKVREVLENA